MRQLCKLLVALVLGVVFISAINYAYRQAVFQGNVAAYTASTASTVRLFENAISETISTIDLVAARGHTDCSSASRRKLDEAVFLSGHVKDILTSSNGVTCSAFDNVGVSMSAYLRDRSPIARQGDDIAFHRVSSSFPGIGVSRSSGDDTAFVMALVNASAFAAGTLDNTLEGQSSVAIIADDGAPIVTTPNFMLGVVADDFMRFGTRSEVYPFSVVLEVPKSQVVAGLSSYQLVTAALIISVCLVAGWLVTTRFIMPVRPADVIRKAIDCGEITPFLQPIVDLQNGQIEGFEILARWVKPSGFIVGPSEFIAEVERFSLSTQLLRALAAQTGKSMGKLIKQYPRLRFAFNVPPDAFVQTDFVDHFLESLSLAGIASKNATVEVTERQEIPDVAQARIAVQELQSEGVKVSIDDVGTGHNGLSVIAAMAPNVIKIDKYFIDGLPANQRAYSMVEMLVRTAHSLGMQTVAEGIETHAQVEALMALGVDCGQGFHIAKPMAPDKAIELYLRHEEFVQTTSQQRLFDEVTGGRVGEIIDAESGVAVAA